MEYDTNVCQFVNLLMVIYICTFWYRDVTRRDLGESLYVIETSSDWPVAKFVLVKFEPTIPDQVTLLYKDHKTLSFNCIFRKVITPRL